MNYHMIRTDDMLNGDGLRVVVFLSMCDHGCFGCHNPETWTGVGSKQFDDDAIQKIYSELDKDYISGITLSGGDPLNAANLDSVYELIVDIKKRYSNKNIWLYTGYTWEEIVKDDNRYKIAKMCDVVVDGRFIKELADVNYPWAGSTNQRVIDVHATLATGNKAVISRLYFEKEKG